jgi:hypothetical protein
MGAVSHGGAAMPSILRVLCPGAAAVFAAMLFGCATSSHVMIGTARPPISPESVRVYVQPPEKYEEIAALDATSSGSFAITSQQNMDKAIGRMKEEAAKLGANGILRPVSALEAPSGSTTRRRTASRSSCRRELPGGTELHAIGIFRA